MKKLLAALFLTMLIPLLASCASPKEMVTGTGEIVEGAGKGAVELGKGTAATTVASIKAAGYAAKGQPDKAIEAGIDAGKAGVEGVKTAVEVPLKSLGEGLKTIDEGITKSTKSEKVK